MKSQKQRCYSKKIVYSYFVPDIAHRVHLMLLKSSKVTLVPDGRLIVGVVLGEMVVAKKVKASIFFKTFRIGERT